MWYCAIFYPLQILLCLLALIALGSILGRILIEPDKAKCKCKTLLHGKIALVTGGNTGIGLETAKDLAQRGARIIIACRDAEKSKKAIEEIIQTSGNTKVEYRHLDLSNPKCIRQFANDFNKTFDRLDILVNNAGCGGVNHRLTENGVDIIMQVNHIGPFLLTNLLMDKIIASKPSRIVIVSSKMHNTAKLDIKDIAQEKTTNHLLRYCNSKLCNVLWARALARRLPEGVTVNSLHPGLVNTEFFKRLNPVYEAILKVVITLLFKTPKEGAQTTIHLCVAPELKNCSGGYYSECKLREYYKIARDEEFAEKVWTESMRLSEKW